MRCDRECTGVRVQSILCRPWNTTVDQRTGSHTPKPAARTAHTTANQPTNSHPQTTALNATTPSAPSGKLVEASPHTHTHTHAQHSTPTDKPVASKARVVWDQIERDVATHGRSHHVVPDSAVRRFLHAWCEDRGWKHTTRISEHPTIDTKLEFLRQSTPVTEDTGDGDGDGDTRAHLWSYLCEQCLWVPSEQTHRCTDSPRRCCEQVFCTACQEVVWCFDESASENHNNGKRRTFHPQHDIVIRGVFEVEASAPTLASVSSSPAALGPASAAAPGVPPTRTASSAPHTHQQKRKGNSHRAPHVYPDLPPEIIFDALLEHTCADLAHLVECMYRTPPHAAE